MFEKGWVEKIGIHDDNDDPGIILNPDLTS